MLELFEGLIATCLNDLDRVELRLESGFSGIKVDVDVPEGTSEGTDSLFLLEKSSGVAGPVNDDPGLVCSLYGKIEKVRYTIIEKYIPISYDVADAKTRLYWFKWKNGGKMQIKFSTAFKLKERFFIRVKNKK